MNTLTSNVLNHGYGLLMIGQFFGCASFVTKSAMEGNVAGVAVGLVGMGLSATSYAGTGIDPIQNQGLISQDFNHATWPNEETYDFSLMRILSAITAPAAPQMTRRAFSNKENGLLPKIRNI